jgi:hypothetical protein
MAKCLPLVPAHIANKADAPSLILTNLPSQYMGKPVDLDLHPFDSLPRQRK